MDWDISMEVIKRTENILPSHKPTKEELEDIRLALKKYSQMCSYILLNFYLVMIIFISSVLYV